MARKKLAPLLPQVLVVLALTAVPLVIHAFVPYRVSWPSCHFPRVMSLGLLALLGLPVLRLILWLVRGRVRESYWPSGLVVAMYALILLVLGNFLTAPMRLAALGKTVADQRTLMSAVSLYYQASAGRLPERLEDLLGVPSGTSAPTAAPFIAWIPRPAPGWSEYHYEVRSDGTFAVSNSGPDACQFLTVINGDVRRGD